MKEDLEESLGFNGDILKCEVCGSLNLKRTKLKYEDAYAKVLWHYKDYPRKLIRAKCNSCNNEFDIIQKLKY